jgi:hypothetical protein
METALGQNVSGHRTLSGIRFMTHPKAVAHRLMGKTCKNCARFWEWDWGRCVHDPCPNHPICRRYEPNQIPFEQRFIRTSKNE